MMVNLAWVRGYQNVNFNLGSRKFERNKDKDIRVTSNKMLPIVRRIQSRLVSPRPVWEVIPATSEQEDLEIASLATKVLRNAWLTVGMDMKQITTAFWMSTTCSAFQKIGWDFDKGDEVQVALQGVQDDLLSQFMERLGIEQESPQSATIRQGELFVDVLTPFNLTFEDDIDNIEEAMWVIEHQIRSKDWIIEKFGNKWKDKLEESDIASTEYVYPYIHGNIDTTLIKRGIMTHEFFVKDSNKYPQGLHCLIVGSEYLISPQDLPFEHGELPYSHFREIYDGSFYGTCSSEQVRGKQSLYNDLKTSFVKNAALMGNIQWLNPRLSNAGPFTNKPGGVINYDPRGTHIPQPVTPKPMPAYMERLLDRTILDIQDTASNHDVSQGKAEPGVRSGKAVVSLQEADDSVLAPVAQAWDFSMIRTGRLALNNIAQFTTEEAVLNIVGDDNEQESITFDGLRLKGQGNGNYFKVRTITSGRQFLSRASREQMVQTLFQIGLIEPKDKDVILHMLGTSDVMSLFDQDASSRQKQYREIDLIIQGEQVLVIPGQKDRVHIQIIDKFISDSRWDKLDQEQQLAIVQHREMHLKNEAAEIAKREVYVQLAAQSLIGPQSPTGGGGSTGGSTGGNTSSGQSRSPRPASSSNSGSNSGGRSNGNSSRASPVGANRTR